MGEMAHLFFILFRNLEGYSNRFSWTFGCTIREGWYDCMYSFGRLFSFISLLHCIIWQLGEKARNTVCSRGSSIEPLKTS